MALRRICRVDELPPRACRVADVDGREIAVANVDGAFYAFRNVCPHQGARLCFRDAAGLGGTMLPSSPHEYVYGLDGRVLRCPWHGWEFDVTTGRALFDDTMRVKTYEVSVDGADVLVDA
jgi:nitrite reductase/ring-hydroxylating ferredoxin subunit